MSCPAGPARTPEEIYGRIDLWHDGAGKDLTWHQYLGWTSSQYATWVQTHALPDFCTCPGSHGYDIEDGVEICAACGKP